LNHSSSSTLSHIKLRNNSIYCTLDDSVMKLNQLCDLIKKEKTQALIKKPLYWFFLFVRSQYITFYTYRIQACLKNGDWIVKYLITKIRLKCVYTLFSLYIKIERNFYFIVIKIVEVQNRNSIELKEEKNFKSSHYNIWINLMILIQNI